MERGTPSVELKGVTKRFGDLVAVDDLSLELAGASSSPCSGRAAAARRRRCG